jgi:hypothetical protein
VTTEAKLALYSCKVCGKTFDEGRKLGGHVRQSHPLPKSGAEREEGRDLGGLDGKNASRVLEMWKSGAAPLDIVVSLRLHPRFVKEVLKEYDELLNEWKRFKEA